MSGKLSTPSASLVPLSQGDSQLQLSNVNTYFLPLRQGEYPEGGEGVDKRTLDDDENIPPSVATLLVSSSPDVKLRVAFPIATCGQPRRGVGER